MTEKLYAAEYVFPGHPDKLSDVIADALVQAAGRLEERALVGVEVAVHRNQVFITGRIACQDASTIDIDALVRDVYRTAGYGDNWDPAPEALEIHADLCLAPLEGGEAEFREVADDQSICTGYAINHPETNYLPLEHWLANHLGRRLQSLRSEFPDLGLGPDGKILVVVNQSKDDWCLEEFTGSLQQRASGDDVALHRAVRVTLESEMATLATEYSLLSQEIPQTIRVNGAGSFDLGGPEGDNGLSGKKLVVDAYGPRVPIGGGALSGKDFFKVDRAGALHARRVAKAIVLTGAAEEATVNLAWFPGETTAQILSIEAGDGSPIPPDSWQLLFDLSLLAAGEAWTDSANLLEVARFGHFTDAARPWEQLRFATDWKSSFRAK